jgi:hypothetical protein
MIAAARKYDNARIVAAMAVRDVGTASRAGFEQMWGKFRLAEHLIGLFELMDRYGKTDKQIEDLIKSRGFPEPEESKRIDPDTGESVKCDDPARRFWDRAKVARWERDRRRKEPSNGAKQIEPSFKKVRPA